MISLPKAQTPPMTPPLSSHLPWLPFAAAGSATEVAGAGAHLLQAVGLDQAFVAWAHHWDAEAVGFPARIPEGVREAAAGLPDSGSVYGWKLQRLFGTLGGGAAMVGWREQEIIPGPGAASQADLQSTIMEALQLRLQPLLEVDRLQTETQDLLHAQRLQRALFDIATLTHSGLDFDQILKKIHEIVQTLMYAENFFIALYEKATEDLRFVYFSDSEDDSAPDNGEVLPLSVIENGPTWHVIHLKKALRGSTAELNEQVGGKLQIHGSDSDDWLGVPMIEDGEVAGVMVVQSYLEQERYTNTDEQVLSFVAGHVLSVLQRKHAHDEMEATVMARTKELREEIQERERGERLQAALYQIVAMAEQDQDEQEFYTHVHSVISELISARNLYVALLDDDKTGLHFPYSVDERQGVREPRQLSRGFTEYVMRTGKALLATGEAMDELVAAGEVDPYFATGKEDEAKASCWLGVPLLTRGEVIGVVAVQSYDSNFSYSENDLQLLTFASYQFANSLRRRRQDEALLLAKNDLERRVEVRTHDLQREITIREETQQQLHHQVLHDSLTGLPNRRQLRMRMEKALERASGGEGSMAVLYMDVDRFKVINDSLGHMEGDRVLEEVARRLSETVRAPDMVARIAGDEFVVLLERAGRLEDCQRVAQRIIDSFNEPLRLEGRPVPVSVSVGISIYHPRHQRAEDIMREADQALYAAKDMGRGRWQAFDDSMAQDKTDVLQVEGEMRASIHDKRFIPYFQPIVDLSTGTPVAFEALLRWNHPERGILAPSEILPVAESSGLIDVIDWELFAAALTTGRHLVAESGYISVNVSPRHFRDHRIDERIMQLLQRTNTHPSRLRIEVTEGTLLNNPDAAAEVFERLRTQGVKIALDDFGTGYSSLNYINKFPLHMIKIDRSFVQDLHPQTAARANAVTQAIMTLGHSLNIEIVAEGIETEVQRKTLMSLGCRYGQGYLFGRPAPPSQWMPLVGRPAIS